MATVFASILVAVQGIALMRAGYPELAIGTTSFLAFTYGICRGYWIGRCQ